MTREQAWEHAIARIYFYGRLIELRNQDGEWQAQYVKEDTMPKWEVIGWEDV